MRVKHLLATATVATGLAVAAVAAPAFANGTFKTLDNLNLRECPIVGSGCPVDVVVPKGTYLDLQCWYPGTSVSGDTVWYYTNYTSGGTTYYGMVAGYYMNTGHDPNPSVAGCP